MSAPLTFVEENISVSSAVSLHFSAHFPLHPDFCPSIYLCCEIPESLSSQGMQGLESDFIETLPVVLMKPHYRATFATIKMLLIKIQTEQTCERIIDV